MNSKHTIKIWPGSTVSRYGCQFYDTYKLEFVQIRLHSTSQNFEKKKCRKIDTRNGSGGEQARKRLRVKRAHLYIVARWKTSRDSKKKY